MGNIKATRRSKIILVPYPAQGHVTPMLKLASAFLSHGFDPVMIVPEFIHRRIISSIEISCVSVPDGLQMDAPRDFFANEKAIESCLPIHLKGIVHRLDEDGEVACMVVDLLVSSAIEVGHRCGVPVAGFWPAMLATYQLVSAIPDMTRVGLISDNGNPQVFGPAKFLHNQPLLSSEKLPWLIGCPSARKARFKFWTRTMERSKSLQWLLVNSFLEDSVDDHVKPQNGALLNNHSRNRQPVVFPVGPLRSKHGTLKNPSFWLEDTSCLQWLDKQNPGSVIYVSFGSWVSPIGEGKMTGLALTLEALGRPFMWVLGDGWRKGLPAGYIDRVSKQGKVVSWAPQMEVLQHKAVGCYLTHCGWNSTMEAIQCQKRLLCYPVAGDQFLNCGYIVQKWRIGVQINEFGLKDIEEGLKTVMEDNEMGCRLKTLYEKTMGEEASSKTRSTLTEFIDDIQRTDESAIPLALEILSSLLNALRFFMTSLIWIIWIGPRF
ncbi:hypothetical protein K2173_009799 [Erythroxylum novogranatense]|uniref:Glycosyltransferase n=1 Tax=Erythroxylum novogranatense TaxID=1862640 RepID=A0AAV8T0D3_9ROSI|nr:hypothetical protein K2173_009799 [Erythroxylum novogranatense]